MAASLSGPTPPSPWQTLPNPNPAPCSLTPLHVVHAPLLMAHRVMTASYEPNMISDTSKIMRTSAVFLAGSARSALVTSLQNCA